MKKTLLLAATAALVSMPSLADQAFLSLELGGGKFDTSGNSSDTKQVVDNLDDAGFISLKGGTYINDNVRVYGYIQTNGESTYELISLFETDKAELTSYQLGAGADYLYDVTDKFYLVAGGSLGYYNSKLKLSNRDRLLNTYDELSDTNSGAVLGVNTGLGYHFTEQFSMELGYRYSYYHDNSHEFGSAKFEFESSNTGYLNASYSF
ncbi:MULTISPECIES: outer membrane beta-barrel protein [Vibrio]|uniref:outer membrane beta-barrel protein n=1 Tax=Vibrio TaxID=662 RepID=UPI00248DCF5C|nr:outer membrane beta-barrel protein [Vibrio sp. St2]